jgi:tryptophanyl-tRNA synthetase
MQTMLSAIQPTQYPHLGNYLGAVRPWVKLQETYHAYCFVVDLHALTVPQDPVALRHNTFEAIAFYLAAGLDPKKVTLFVQSHVKEHTELAWLLTCFTHMGELNRMTQFKDKSQKSGNAIGVGLFTYPILMAADILLYHPDVIPVGEDQKQHVELTRDLAGRINHLVKSPLFKAPMPLIQEAGARVMDLQDPTSKMSKSAQSPNGVVFLNETNASIEKKFKTAVTDSGDKVEISETKPGVSNLLRIQSAISGKSLAQLEQDYDGKKYGHLKLDTAQLVISTVEPIREKAKDYMNHKDYLLQILRDGAQKASQVAAPSVAKISEALGLIKL